MITTKPEIRHRYTVIVANCNDKTPERAIVKSVDSPRYDRERDEPAFRRAWAKVVQLKADGAIKPIPPRPAGGIKLRGKSTK